MAVLAGSTPAQAATIRIANLSDIGFTSLNPLMSASVASNVCVYSTSGRYGITATGSGSGSSFDLNAGAGLDLAYGVQWAATSGASTGTALSAGTMLSGQSTALLSLCSLGATSATLIVTLSSASLQTATAGVTYTGVLTLLVTPQ